MKYTLDKQERYAHFSVLDENLNSVVAPEFKSEFVVMRNEGTRNLILDLSAVKYVDSSGLSAILTANRLFQGEDGSFVLTGVEHAPVKKLVEISRLDAVVTVVPTFQEAIDYIFMEDIERELISEDDDDN